MVNNLWEKYNLLVAETTLAFHIFCFLSGMDLPCFLAGEGGFKGCPQLSQKEKWMPMHMVVHNRDGHETVDYEHHSNTLFFVGKGGTIFRVMLYAILTSHSNHIALIRYCPTIIRSALVFLQRSMFDATTT